QMGVNMFWNDVQKGAGLVSGNFGQFAPMLNTFADTAIPIVTETFNLYGLYQPLNIGAAISILDRYGLAKVISQPTLVSLSGQKAEFLAGGQVPIITPGTQGFATVQYRPFGTRMMFIPTVLADDVIDVQVDLELSQLDEAVGINLRGNSVPGFNSRR